MCWWILEGATGSLCASTMVINNVSQCVWMVGCVSQWVTLSNVCTCISVKMSWELCLKVFVTLLLFNYICVVCVVIVTLLSVAPVSSFFHRATTKMTLAYLAHTCIQWLENRETPWWALIFDSVALVEEPLHIKDCKPQQFLLFLSTTSMIFWKF